MKCIIVVPNEKTAEKESTQTFKSQLEEIGYEVSIITLADKQPSNGPTCSVVYLDEYGLLSGVM